MTPVILPLIVAATLAIVLALYTWQKWSQNSMLARILMLQLIGVAYWCTFYIAEIGAPSPDVKITLAKVKYLAIVVLPVFVFLFGAYFHNLERSLTRNRLIALFVFPALSWIMVSSTELHGIFWTNIAIVQDQSVTLVDSTAGIWFWLHAGYSYLLMLAGTLLLVHQFSRQQRVFRLQIVPFVVAIIAPWIANLFVILDLTVIDYTPSAFLVTGIAMYIGVFGFRLFELRPVARDYVMDMIDDMMIVIDSNNIVIDMNKSARGLFPNSSVNAVGKPISQLIGENYAGLLKQYDDVARAREEIEVDVGGNKRYFDVRISQVLDADQQLQGRVVVLRDITERKQATEQIRQQNDALTLMIDELAVAQKQAEEAGRLKSEFLATMSHELRTPLNAIIGYTEIQLEGMAGPLNDEQKDYQSRVLRNGEHLLGLINNILDLSKIEAGRLEIQEQPFKVDQWANALLLQVTGLADSKNLALSHQFDPKLPGTLLGDPARLTQITLNLMSNAIKFTEEGQVSLHLDKVNDKEWQISVKDTGIGIPPHLQETIFEEFRQVDGSSKRQHEGTGLGLAIVRKLVGAMKGTVRVVSTVGQGSEFIVTLPLLQPAEQEDSVALTVEVENHE